MKVTIQCFIFLKLVSFSISAKAQADIPVDFQHGKAMITVPITEIKDKGISVPISISYNSSGVQVSSSESGNDLVGINWSLLAGGKITRKVNGLPDDYYSNKKKGWLQDNTSRLIGDYIINSDNSLSTSLDEQGDWNILDSDTGFHYVDTEPDEFEIVLPGLSGKFIFDNNKIIRTFPYQDIKISCDFLLNPSSQHNRQIYEFDITASDGTRYIFNKAVGAVMSAETLQEGETNIPQFRRQYDLYKPTGTGFIDYYSNSIFGTNGVEYITSWLLTKITSPNGGVVSLNYYQSDPITKDHEISNPIVNPVSFGDDHKYYALLSKQEDYKIKSISSSTGTRADFLIYSATANNLNQLKTAYKSIAISDSLKETRQQIKNYELSYYVTKDPESKVRKVFLKSIQETTTCYKFPPFKFSYYGVDSLSTTLPEASNGSQDYFGYFNNYGAATLSAPKLWWASNPLTHQFFFSLYKGNGNSSPLNNTSEFDTRQLHYSAVTAGSLSKVTYPPGGYVTLEYEPNVYYHKSNNQYFDSQNFPAAGIRAKKIVSHDGINEENNIIKEYEYLEENGISSGVLNYPYQFAFDGGPMVKSEFNLYKDVELRYERVTVKLAGKKNSVYEYLMPPMFPDTLSNGWNATLPKPVRHIVNNVYSTGAWQKSDYYGYPFVRNTNIDYEDGLLNKKYDFDGNGKLVKKTEYEYQRITPGEIVIRAIKFDNMHSDYLLAEYNWLCDVKRVLKKETVSTVDQTDPALMLEAVTNHFYDSPNHKFLSRITTENSKGEINEKKITYVKDYQLSTGGTDDTSNALKSMNDNHMLNQVVEEISSLTKNGVKKILGATLTKYKSSGAIPGLVAEILELPRIETFVPAYLETTGNLNRFQYDTNYISTTKFEKYDDKGNILALNDGKKNKKGFLWGYNKRYVVAEIINATPDEVAFSDFETTTGQEFDMDENIITDAHSGSSSQFVYMGYNLQKTIKKGDGKFYRFTCYAKIYEISGKKISIILSDGTHTVSAYMDSDPVLGRWKFYEKLIDVSTLNSSFTIQIVCGDDLALDDAAFYPAIANIKTYTYHQPFGKASEADSKGGIVYYEYDDLGRIKLIRDRDQNIIKLMEYKINHDYPVEFSADIKEKFYSNIENYTNINPNNIYAGDTWRFLTDNNCTQDVTHAWYVNNEYRSNYDQIQYYFPTPGNYTIKHVATHPVYGTKTSEIVKTVIPIPLTATMSTQDFLTTTWCDYINNRINKTFKMNINTGSSSGAITYRWTYAKDPSAANIIVLAGGKATDNYITIRFPYSYYVNCTVSNAVQPIGASSDTMHVLYNSQDCDEVNSNNLNK